MSVKNYLKEHQPHYYQLLKKSFKNGRINHAYLLIGEADQESLFLAQSLLCEESLLACEECHVCRRVKENQYSDFIMFDGSQTTIKKGDIEYIQEEFNKSAVEGINKVYLLKNVDYATTMAMNSLLKFLEEPVENVFAILTTNNINKVLPTIQSRCQIIRLLPESKEMLIGRLMNDQIEEEDARILASLFNSYDHCKEFIENEAYESLKENAIYFVEDYFEHPDNLIVNQQFQITNKYKSNRQLVAAYLNMVVLAFRDVFHVKHNVALTYTKHEMFFKNLPNSDRILEIIEIILDTIPAVELNANIPLAIDGMVYKILEGVTHGTISGSEI